MPEDVSEIHRLPLAKDALFARGWLLLTDADDAADRVAARAAVLEHWHYRRVAGWQLWSHPALDVTTHHLETAGAWLLLGHAYDAWDGIADERHLLAAAASGYRRSESAFLDTLANWTGRFCVVRLAEDGGLAIQDAGGLQAMAYLHRDSRLQLSSHAQLLAELFACPPDPDAMRLTRSRFYNIGIRHMPGCYTLYRAIRLLTANTMLTWDREVRIRRVFPVEARGHEISPAQAVEIAAPVLRRSIAILADRQWPVRMALSGGVDSRVSLAASSDHHHRISYFTYGGAAEARDLAVATRLAEQLGLSFTPVELPQADHDAVEALRPMLARNGAFVRNSDDERLAAMILRRAQEPRGFEIRSSVSEITRCFFARKFRIRPGLPRLSPSHMSIMYKRNVYDVKMMRWVEDAFEDFIPASDFDRIHGCSYHPLDLFYWEHRVSTWQSLVAQDIDYYAENTVLFNNRRLLDLLLRVDWRHRIDDGVHKRLAGALWPESVSVPFVKNFGWKSSPREIAEAAAYRLYGLVSIARGGRRRLRVKNQDERAGQRSAGMFGKLD